MNFKRRIAKERNPDTGERIPKILIIGGSGLLGFKLGEFLEHHNYNVHSTYHQTPPGTSEKKYRLDITKKEDVENLLQTIQPEIIIHTAAYTNVDACEKNQAEAYAVNVGGTLNLLQSNKKIGAKFVYISTDYVFDGNKGLYKEDDERNPINYYGRTKLEGELLVEQQCDDFIIARTSVLYGSQKNNFILWLLEQLGQGKQVKIVDDQYVSPTLNLDLSEQLVKLIEQNATGVFHTAGGERISRYDFAVVVADVFGYDDHRVNPVRMQDMNWLAPRPRDSSLDVSKLTPFKKPYKVKEAMNLLREELGSRT
jgi:dTDP-4-dehydrorhamnose reductase